MILILTAHSVNLSSTKSPTNQYVMAFTLLIAFAISASIITKNLGRKSHLHKSKIKAIKKQTSFQRSPLGTSKETVLLT